MDSAVVPTAPTPYRYTHFSSHAHNKRVRSCVHDCFWPSSLGPAVCMMAGWRYWRHGIHPGRVKFARPHLRHPAAIWPGPGCPHSLRGTQVGQMLPKVPNRAPAIASTTYYGRVRLVRDLTATPFRPLAGPCAGAKRPNRFPDPAVSPWRRWWQGVRLSTIREVPKGRVCLESSPARWVSIGSHTA